MVKATVVIFYSSSEALAFSAVASLAKSLAQAMADEVWMVEVPTNGFKNKREQGIGLCIPSGEALANR